MVNDKKNNRKVYLINPDFQLRFIGVMWASAAAIIGLIYASNVYFFSIFYKAGISEGLHPNSATYQFLRRQELAMNGVFLILVIAIFIGMTIWGILFSHRIAGPLHRFNLHLKNELLDKQLHEMHLRKKDFFQEVFQSYNDLVKKKNS